MVALFCKQNIRVVQFTLPNSNADKITYSQSNAVCNGGKIPSNGLFLGIPLFRYRPILQTAIKMSQFYHAEVKIVHMS